MKILGNYIIITPVKKFVHMVFGTNSAAASYLGYLKFIKSFITKGIGTVMNVVNLIRIVIQ